MSFAEGGVLQRVLTSPLVGALTWPHGVDRYLELIDPQWAFRETRGSIISVTNQTPDTVTLLVAPNAAWHGHDAGQHVNVGVEINGVFYSRCYSVVTSSHGSDRASDVTIEFTIKAHRDGLVSSHLVNHAVPGENLLLSPPSGDFVLPTDRPGRLVLISGGSGITPVLSMLRTLCDEGHNEPITFVHYSFGSHDALYADEVAELASLNPNINVVRAYTDSDDGDLSGFFTLEHLDTADPDWRNAELYVCGPSGLMDAVEATVAEVGDIDRVHSERFALASRLTVEDLASATGSLTFAAASKTVANSGQTVLEQAEEAGLNPKFGCRMGVCHTCIQPKTSGCVRNLLTGALSDVGEQDIQICISAPVGDVVVDI